MGPKITILPAPPLNGQFYSSHDEINGTVHLSISKSLPIKNITVLLRGFAETMTKFDQEYLMSPSLQEHRSYHTLLDMETRVFPPDNVWDALEGSSKPFKVKPGEYDYQFKFDKFPRRPKCLANHRVTDTVFVKRRENYLPPSFNNKWKEFNKIDNLDLYFYSLGKIIYNLQVRIELGKSMNWYKPFDKFLREYSIIEFIPDSKLLEQGLNGSPTSSALPQGAEEMTMAMYPEDIKRPPLDLRSMETELNTVDTDPSSANGTFSRDTMIDRLGIRSAVPATMTMGNEHIYKSRYKIGLPDGDSNLWLEIRSRDNAIKQTYRMDPMFQEGSGRFDQVFLMLSCSSDNVRETLSMVMKNVAAKKLQLNLLETVTFLSQGVGNENFSSLRLAALGLEADVEGADDVFDGGEFEYVSRGSKHSAGPMYYKFQCELKLKKIPALQYLYFNQEDYRHRGNRLYSFKTCTIKREFQFQLLIDWEINGSAKVGRQTEVIIKPVQIFCQCRPNSSALRSGAAPDYTRGGMAIGEVDALPLYVPPPEYVETPKDT
ncbi:hypothetical protein NCAS_0J01500 [Naumovozyma castellii]|uniref:Arrestin-like N-terminal domain-containing protein n=1 Tax=Naumovozyma castellii TaxID=27288 RepID=G0VKU1_NAUCA|nr:hypothetical protein NCAS_0J01500 [Naumovozyma castellii CBS 4309]CCC72129.1 hypothetical protein NCAS_0J01500 [Naumovozyma castellii CBS 4309]